MFSVKKKSAQLLSYEKKWRKLKCIILSRKADLRKCRTVLANLYMTFWKMQTTAVKMETSSQRQEAGDIIARGRRHSKGQETS